MQKKGYTAQALTWQSSKVVVSRKGIGKLMSNEGCLEVVSEEK